MRTTNLTITDSTKFYVYIKNVGNLLLTKSELDKYSPTDVSLYVVDTKLGNGVVSYSDILNFISGTPSSIINTVGRNFLRASNTIKFKVFKPKIGNGLAPISTFSLGDETSTDISLGYGLLYNWYAATDERGLAPSGFRVPSEDDLNTLLSNYANNTAAGIALRSDRTDPTDEPSWPVPNSGDNSSGFLLFPAANRLNILDDPYKRFKDYAYLWSTSTQGFGPDEPFRLSINESSTLITSAAKSEGLSIRCVSDSEPSTDLVQDADGNNYSWVQIGAQYWLQQNLKTTKYNNGDPIPTGLDNAAWASTTDGAWAYPNGDNTLPI